MQKNNLKASILIWAIFLSLIISVSFISINTKINKNLNNQKNNLDEIKTNNEINRAINNEKINKTFSDIKLENGYSITFDSINEYSLTLNKFEKHIIKINENSEISINILKGGPINTSSGLITSTGSYTLTSGDFEIKNLGGYTKLEINSSSSKNYLNQYTNYKIVKTIGNKEIIKGKGKIKNF